MSADIDLLQLRALAEAGRRARVAPALLSTDLSRTAAFYESLGFRVEAVGAGAGPPGRLGLERDGIYLFFSTSRLPNAGSRPSWPTPSTSTSSRSGWRPYVILLAGVPGTGKTTLAESLATRPDIVRWRATWEHVKRMQGRWEPWEEPHLVLDSAVDPPDVGLRRVLDELSAADGPVSAAAT